MKFRNKVVSLILITGLSACASVLHSSKQPVAINSNPPGATLQIDNQTFTTPAVVKLKGKSEYPFTLEKDGYKPATGKVDSEFRVWSVVLGNIVNLTGLIGVGVDVWGTGSAYEMAPNNTVTLQPNPMATMMPQAPVMQPQGNVMVPVQPGAPIQPGAVSPQYPSMMPGSSRTVPNTQTN